MTQGVTDISADVYSMHMIAFWLCVAIGVVVFSVMFYSIFAHRKSKGVQPRTFLEQLVATNPELAKNKIIQKLLGEQDVPTQKGRDAKRDVLKPKAMNTVKQGIKQAAKKQRRKMDKDAVDEQVDKR